MNYVEDIDAAQFFPGDTCRAAGIDVPTLKNWINRKPSAILVTDEDRAAIAALGVTGASRERLAHGHGRPHLFTFRRVMQIAITAELVELGFPLRRAGNIAVGFTDLGEGPIGGAPERLPGELFDTGLTILVASSADEAGEIINVNPTKTLVTEVLFSRVAGRRPSAVIVNINDIDRRVREALGLSMNWVRRLRN